MKAFKTAVLGLALACCFGAGMTALFSGLSAEAQVRPPAGSGTGAGGGCANCALLDAPNTFTSSNAFVIDAGIQARVFNATTSAMYGNLIDAGIQTSDGGGLGMTRPAAYNCSGVVNGVPCVANPYGIIELYGSLPVGTASNDVCAVEVYDYNDLGAGADTCVFGIGIGATSTKIFRVMGDNSVDVGGDMNFDGTSGGNRIVQSAANNYMEITGNATTNGVAVYLDNINSGALATGGTLTAWYNPSYSGSNVFNVEHDGALKFLGTATGSLGTCNSGNEGRLQYDTTTKTLKWCNGTAWAPMTSFPSVTAAWSATCFNSPCATEAANFTGATAGVTGTVRNISCSWNAAGTGTGDVVVKIRNVTDSSDLCSCTLGACTTAANSPLTCSCNTAMNSAKVYTFQLDSSTNCSDTNPGQIVCTANTQTSAVQ